MNRVKTSRRGPQKKVFALYNKGNLTIEKSKRENPTAPEAKEPTVAEMTRKSIELLDSKKGKKGFYLQVEGALIDKRSSGIINGAGKDDPANFGPATFRTPR